MSSDQNIITRKRGDTVPDQRTIVTSGGGAASISGNSFLLTINSEPEPSDTQNQILQTVGQVGAGGVVQFPFSTEQADQVPGQYYYDIQQTTELGLIKTLESGVYLFVQDITK